MNFIRFNRPVPSNPIASALDDFFQKGLSELAKTDFSHSRPGVNIIEQDDAFVVELAAPGLKKDDFEIKVDKDQLIVKVTNDKESTSEEETAGDITTYRRREFNYSSFTRSFHLPESINTDSIDAAYESGVLKISLAKKEEAKEKEPRTIAIS